VLAWIEAVGLKAILDWVLAKIVALIKAYQKQKADHEKQVNQAEADSGPAKAVTPDSTEKEVDDAIDSELNHL
jgi:hypothetical protein